MTTVRASDLDQGLNAELSYFFNVNGELEPRVDVFRINQMTGEIQTTNLLDRETQAVYELIVSLLYVLHVHTECVCVYVYACI